MRPLLFMVVLLATACGSSVTGDPGGDDSGSSPPSQTANPPPQTINPPQTDPPPPAGDPSIPGTATQSVLVVVGTGGRTMRSLDSGLTWVDDRTLIANGDDDVYGLRTVTYGNGQFLALGWRVMTSPDGKTWTDHGEQGTNWFGSVRWQTDHYVSVGGYGQRANSVDGIHWTDHSIDTDEAHPHDALVCTATVCVSANDKGKLSFSKDGTDWSYSTTSATAHHMAFGAGVFVGAGNTLVVSSDSGKTWKKVADLASAAGGIVFAEDSLHRVDRWAHVDLE